MGRRPKAYGADDGIKVFVPPTVMGAATASTSACGNRSLLARCSGLKRFGAKEWPVAVTHGCGRAQLGIPSVFMIFSMTTRVSLHLLRNRPIPLEARVCGQQTIVADRVFGAE